MMAVSNLLPGTAGSPCAALALIFYFYMWFKSPSAMMMAIDGNRIINYFVAYRLTISYVLTWALN
jgi:hypothetical protein